MAKTWQCTQCGQKVTTTIQDSWNENEPDECSNCGNGSFEVLRVTGSLHQAIDSDSGVGNATTRRRALKAIGGGVIAVGGSWWFFGRPTVASTTEVSMENSQFIPRNIEVETGATVTWANNEDSGEGEPITYLLRSTEGWDFEADVPEDEDASYQFTETGVYGLYAEGLGSEDLTGMSMKIGVGESIEEPLGGWF